MTNHVDLFGRLVAQQRKRFGLTQQQVGQHIGLHQTGIAKIEKGGPLSFNNGIELAMLLDINITEMTAGEGNLVLVKGQAACIKRNVAQQLRSIADTLDAK